MRELLSSLSAVGFGQASLRCRSYTGVLVEVGHEPARGMHAEVGDVGKKHHSILSKNIEPTFVNQPRFDAFAKDLNPL
jgi:hypothetical protein